MSAAGTTADGEPGAVARSGLDARGRPGEPATSVEYRVDAERTVGLLAEALASLHATVLTPEDQRAALGPPKLVEMARTAVAASDSRTGRQGAYAHLDDDRLLEILAEGADRIGTRVDPPVLTHGAPSLAHLWCDRGRLVGLVGWSHPAPSDRYRDLAVAARSIATDLTPALVPVLFERYGEVQPDPVRLDWYALAAEMILGTSGPAALR